MAQEALADVFCLVVLVLLSVLPTFGLIIHSRIFCNDIETIGVVIGFESDSDGTTSIVRYVTQHGQEVTIPASGSYELGQRVIVRYPSHDPERGSVKKDTIAALSCAVAVSVFIILVAF